MTAGRTYSVIIPTRNRPAQVTAAVGSALAQTLESLEVIVVVDGPDEATSAALAAIDDARLTTIVHPESAGAGAARNTGIQAARGDYVAFLDDDDLWLPRKLEVQDRRLAEAEGPVVLGTAAHWNDGTRTVTWPTRAPEPGERVAHYLFVRDHAGEGVLPTPALVVTRSLAQAHPLPTHLRVHEEWDWMLDLEKAGAHFDVVLEPLVEVDARPRRTSVSSGAAWRASLAWALGRAEDLGPEAFSAFVLTEAARAAVDSHAPVRDHLALAATSLTGRPRPRDLARAAGRPAVASARALRRRLGA